MPQDLDDLCRETDSDTDRDSDADYADRRDAIHISCMKEDVKLLLQQAKNDPRFRLVFEHQKLANWPDQFAQVDIIINGHAIAKLDFYADDVYADLLIEGQCRKKVSDLDGAINHVIDTLLKLRCVCDQKLYHVKTATRKNKAKE